MSLKNLIVFDMDGVLVDVTDSYRSAIQSTVLHLAGRTVNNETIQEYKLRGGFNDDWLLSHRLIEDLGSTVPFRDVVDHFQSVFLGSNNDGLILRERWIAKPGQLETLAKNADLAVFTGRLRAEAFLSLNRFAPGLIDNVVGVDEVVSPKPEPEGLIKILARSPHRNVWYVGDSVDDARAAHTAQVPFIGIASLDSPHRGKLIGTFEQLGAAIVLADINEMDPGVFA